MENLDFRAAEESFAIIDQAARQMREAQNENAFLALCRSELERLIFKHLRAQDIDTEAADRATAARIAKQLSEIIALRRYELEDSIQ